MRHEHIKRVDDGDEEGCKHNDYKNEDRADGEESHDWFDDGDEDDDRAWVCWQCPPKEPDLVPCGGYSETCVFLLWNTGLLSSNGRVEDVVKGAASGDTT